VQTYEDGITKMTQQASALIYRYDNNMGGIDTKPGMGLEDPTTTENPESLAMKMNAYKKRAEFTSDDRDRLQAMPIELGNQIAKYINNNDTHFYWKNSDEQGDAKEWIDSFLLKFRLLKYVKAVYCIPTGVPTLDIPAPEAFDLNYLSRGGRSQMRIVQKATFDEATIREMRQRIDRVYLSLRSQRGDFNGVGGFVGFINRANSTLTFQNDVEAHLNVLVILREAFTDEIDLITDPVAGCDKVRNRYYERFQTLKDPAFQRTAEAYFAGSIPSNDTGMQAFSRAGSVLLAKGAYVKEYLKQLKAHPESSLLGNAIQNDDDLR
jgi:hypothetical protein